MAMSEHPSVPDAMEAEIIDEAAIVTESVEARRERWLKENAEAIQSYNDWVAKHGLLLEDLRLF